MWRALVAGAVLLAASVAALADMMDDYRAAPGSAAPAIAVTGRRIMVIGDSIQAGTGLKNTQSQASFRLQRYGGVIIHNFASPGATMVDHTFFAGMDRATTAVSLLNGFFGMYGLVINLGNNDWAESVPVSTFSSAYGAFLDSIPSRIKVACMSPTWSTSEGMLNSQGNTKDDFRAATQALCTARGDAYLEGKDAIPNNPAYFADGVHPNDRGHKAMGTFLLRQLRILGWLGG
jgi:lysophospholipase L1-like esterase